MALATDDLKAIDKLLIKRIDPIDKKVSSLDIKVSSLDKKVDKNFIFLKKRFDELFNFMDRKYLQVKGEVRDIQSHFRLPISDF